MKYCIAVLGNLFIINCLLFMADAYAADSSRCDDIIRQVGGPCLFGEGSSAAGFLPNKHRTVAGFLVGRDSFKAAQKIFGHAAIWSSGTDFEAEYKVCYISRGTNENVVVVISSDSEMPGGTVDTLRLIRGDVDFSDRCATSAVAPEKLHTASGIQVGMTQTAFKSIMGEPSAAKGDLLFYGFCDTKEFQPGEQGYAPCLDGGKSVGVRCSGITARFVDGILHWFEIGAAADYEC